MKKISVANKINYILTLFLSAFAILAFYCGSVNHSGYAIYYDRMEQLSFENFVELRDQYPCERTRSVEKLFIDSLCKMGKSEDVQEVKRKITYALGEAIAQVCPVVKINDWLGMHLVSVLCNNNFNALYRFMIIKNVDRVHCRYFNCHKSYKDFARVYLISCENGKKEEIELMSDF